jgi:hypothetical protein
VKIEVRNLKTLVSLSEETHCYTATIYVDGMPAFEASNHGHGGPDDYRAVKGYTGPTEKQIDEWLAKNEPLTGEFADLPNSLEIKVGELINEALSKKRLDGMLRKKIVVLGTQDNQPALFTYGAKLPPTPENIERMKPRVNGEIVNGRADLYEKALALV